MARGIEAVGDAGAVFRLTVLDEVVAGPRVFAVSPDRKVVGRFPDADIQLLGRDVSRHHCTVEAVHGRYVLVRDLASLNGTFLDGRQISGEARAFPGSVIGVGEFRLSVGDLSAHGGFRSVTPVRFHLFRG